MLERRNFLLGLVGFSASGLGCLVGCGRAEGQKMQEIRFDLGRDITETARASGVPSFKVENIDTAIIYSVNAIPADIPARYTRAGYEISWQPLFAFTLWADKDNNSLVDHVVLRLDGSFQTHAEAQAFVEQTLAQFLRSKWQRYHDPVWDALLTGRSSLLNEKGEIASSLLTIDPAYKIPPIDWPVVAKKGATWRWLGDGVLADLTINNLGGDGPKGPDTRVPDYRMKLEFDLMETKLRRDAENEARELKEGDAKGWNSTTKLEADKKERAARNKLLEANAIKRGDSVVKKP